MGIKIKAKSTGAGSLFKLFFGLGCGTLFFILTLSGIVGALAWPYALNKWLVFFGKPASIVWWHGFILGYVPWLGQLSIPVAVCTFILFLFL